MIISFWTPLHIGVDVDIVGRKETPSPTKPPTQIKPPKQGQDKLINAREELLLHRGDVFKANETLKLRCWLCKFVSLKDGTSCNYGEKVGQEIVVK